MMVDLFKTWLPLAVSVAAFLVSVMTLGWTIYRDAIRKPAFKVSVGIKLIMYRERDREPSDDYMSLDALNLGPLPNRVNIAVLRRSQWYRLLHPRDKSNSAIMSPDYSHEAASRYDVKIDVGDTATLVFPADRNDWARLLGYRIGVIDGYGRCHWAPRKQFEDLIKKQLRKGPPKSKA